MPLKQQTLREIKNAQQIAERREFRDLPERLTVALFAGVAALALYIADNI